MLKKTICMLIFLTTLAGCHSYQELSAPCTYESRGGCGPIVPMQQGY